MTKQIRNETPSTSGGSSTIKRQQHELDHDRSGLNEQFNETAGSRWSAGLQVIVT